MHGWAGSQASLLGVAKALSNKCRCTLIDLYGFGGSPHPAHPLTLEDYAAGVLDIIKAYNMEDAVLVGHSFGGRVALLLASKCSRIAGLILTDSAGIRPKHGIKYYYKIYKYKFFKALKISNKDAGSEDYRRLSGAMKDTFVGVVNRSLIPEMKAITVPTLIIWGENDKDTPLYMARRINRYINGSKLNILEGAGHYSYLDCFNQYVGLVRDFIGRLPREEEP